MSSLRLLRLSSRCRFLSSYVSKKLLSGYTIIDIKRNKSSCMMNKDYLCKLGWDKDGVPFAKVEQSGFNFHECDRTDHIPEWTLERFIAFARGRALYRQNFLDWPKVMEDRMVFYIASLCKIEKNFYDRDLLSGPFTTEIKLGYVGTTSYNTVNKTIHTQTGKIIAETTNQLVSIDRDNRKPKPLPDWWVEKYGKATASQPLRYELFKKPENAHFYQTKVSYSDTDSYRHTNQASYVRFCFDAVCDASIAENLPSFTGDVCFYGVRQMEMSFKGESVAGDILNIAVWQDSVNDKTVHCQVFKGDKVIYQQTINFYSDIYKTKL